LSWNKVLSLASRIRQRAFDAVFFDLPCRSWAAACRAGSCRGAAFRSTKAGLWSGLPGLTSEKRRLLQEDNKLWAHAAVLFKIAMSLRVPVLLINPAGSLIWHTRLLGDLVDGGATLLHVDYCQYNVPWKKATTVLVANMVSPQLKVCTGARGVCSRSGRKHAQIKGRFKNGFLKARHAQPMPAQLGATLAGLLFQSRTKRL